MSTYIDTRNLNAANNYDDCPVNAKDFLYYCETIRNLSARTVNGYYIDLRTFFKFLKMHRGLDAGAIFEEIVISDIDLAFIAKITKSEIYKFLHYVMRTRGNAPATRARKLSSLRTFFKYMCSKVNLLADNPTDDIDTPTLKQRLPKYLSLEESLELLKNVNSDFYERDYCIITLFLNCGMRLSELVGIKLSDIKDEQIRIVGKGDKERLVYLNDACINAIRVLCDERAKMPNLVDKNALFVSKRTGKQLSARRVQQIVEGCLKAAGLADKGYSAHKLRHTAATLMYRFGNVDMLALKEILGHEHVSTTEIYTHISEKQLEEAARSTPLAKVKFKKPENNED
ncbi:MAG: tyrosine-type recombinase/integrase [Oscillospiraceae bacterium]